MSERIYPWDLSRLSILQGSRIFLTGGTGFFGKWLLRFFVETHGELGAEVVVLSRNPERFLDSFPEWGNASNVSMLQGDVRSFNFPEGEFDYVIHAATPVGSDRLPYDSPEMYSIIVEGTERVLCFAGSAGAKRLLYVSSGAVYGAQPSNGSGIEESAECAPVNAYGRGKLVAEELCMAQETEVVIARCFAFVGEYLQLDNRFAIGNFILDCIHGRPIEIKGDGTPMRSYMHGADLVEWLLVALVHGGNGGIYNVGSDAAFSIAAVADLVKRIVGLDNEIIVRREVDLGRKPDSYVPSVRKAQKELGLSVRMGLEEAIRATVEHWKGGGDVV